MTVLKWFMLIVSIAAMAVGFAINRQPEGMPSVHSDYYLMLDASASVNPTDVDRLTQLVGSWLLPGIQPGDAIFVFQIGKRTGDLPPLFHSETKPLRRGAPFLEVQASRREMSAIHEGTLAAVRQGITGQAQATEILASLPRIEKRPGRRAVAIFLSDALECSEISNLEKLSLQDANLAQVVEETRAKMDWSQPLWSDLEVHFIVPAPDTRDACLNSMKDLRRYWEAMIQPLGGRLVQFDSFARIKV